MMGLTADEDVSVATENSGTTTPAKEKQHARPEQQGEIETLIEQREAFIRDRFSITLEDPLTGKRIRS